MLLFLLCAMSFPEFSDVDVGVVICCCRRHDASTHCIKIAQWLVLFCSHRLIDLPNEHTAFFFVFVIWILFRSR